jgi:hypothetical protein
MNPWNYLIIAAFVALLVWYAIADQRERDEHRAKRRP